MGDARYEGITTKQETCKMCGMCCTAIILGQPYMNKHWVEETAKRGDPDCKFIIENWEVMTKEEVLSLRPDAYFSESFEKPLNTHTWWRCKQLDKETKKCKCHTDRPRVCIGFPYYGAKEIISGFLWYNPECGYKQEIDSNAGKVVGGCIGSGILASAEVESAT